MTTTRSRSGAEVSTLFTTGAVRATQNVAGSKTFMKILTSVALNALMYHRGLLPIESFYVSIIKGHAVPYLKDLTSNPNVANFQKLLVSIRDALDRGYLKCIMVNVYKNCEDNESLLESYTYNYSYHCNKENSVNKPEKENSKRTDPKHIIEKVSDLLRVLQFRCSQLDPLPENWEYTIYVEYVEGVPIEYNPEGFDACDSMPGMKNFIKMKMGRITTPYHQLLVFNYSDVPKNFDKMDCVFPPKERCIEENNNESEATDQLSQQAVKDLFENNDLFANVEEEKDKEPNKQDANEKETKFPLKKRQVYFADDEEDSLNFCCPCQRNFSSSTFITIKCNSCNKSQHAECFGILEESIKQGFKHYCDSCAAHNYKIVCSDPDLTNTYPEEKKLYCQLRTTLSSFLYYREIDVQMMTTVQHVSKKAAEALLARAETYNIFIKRNECNGNNKPRTWIVDHRALLKLIPSFFRTTDPTQVTEKVPTKHIEQLTLEDKNDELSCTPNVLTAESIDYSPTKVREYSEAGLTFQENLLQFDLGSIVSRRSSRPKAEKRYCEESDEESPERRNRGGRKMFKRNH